jgi:hypothetical protein
MSARIEDHLAAIGRSGAMSTRVPDVLSYELIQRIWPLIPGGITCELCGNKPTGPHGCSYSDRVIRLFLAEHPEHVDITMNLQELFDAVVRKMADENAPPVIMKGGTFLVGGNVPEAMFVLCDQRGRLWREESDRLVLLIPLVGNAANAAARER